MICEECKKKNATVYINKSVSGKNLALALCTECAEKFKQAECDEARATSKQDEPETSSTKCPACHLALSSFENSKDLTLGCPDCYTTFGTEIARRLRFRHGNLAYCGRAPFAQRQAKKKAAYLERLREEMAFAIKNEDFERALTLREMIKSVG